MYQMFCIYSVSIDIWIPVAVLKHLLSLSYFFLTLGTCLQQPFHTVMILLLFK